MRRMFLSSAIALTVLLGMPAAAEDTPLCKQGEEVLGRGNYQLALIDYDRAIRFNPENARLYCNRALSHMGAKDHQRTLKDLDKSEQLDRNLAGAINYNRDVVFAKALR